MRFARKLTARELENHPFPPLNDCARLTKRDRITFAPTLGSVGASAAAHEVGAKMRDSGVDPTFFKDMGARADQPLTFSQQIWGLEGDNLSK